MPKSLLPAVICHIWNLCKSAEMESSLQMYFMHIVMIFLSLQIKFVNNSEININILMVCLSSTDNRENIKTGKK